MTLEPVLPGSGIKETVRFYAPVSQITLAGPVRWQLYIILEMYTSLTPGNSLWRDCLLAGGHQICTAVCCRVSLHASDY